MASTPSLKAEIGPDGLARENPIIAYTEKIIAEEQLQLRKYIEENYTKIRDVERELANLDLEMKLTAGPKKAALEHLRKKIEISTEKIRLAKQKEEQTRKAWEEALQSVKDEESIKQRLCDDLNNLVQESSNAQYARLEELKKRLEAMNPSRVSSIMPPDVKPAGSANGGAASESSSASNTTAENVPNQRDGGNATPMNGQIQKSKSEEEVRVKKKSQYQGRGRGLGAVPKGRGPTAPGWTGAGFET